VDEDLQEEDVARGDERDAGGPPGAAQDRGLRREASLIGPEL
jgi:hypothetical protein